jgi:hypothetical protein
MSDKLVFDLAQEIEGSPNIFIRKDWLNILDNQAQNYNGNQSVIDTSQLSNSNKWMNYREAYLSMPLTITLATTSAPVVTQTGVVPATAGNAAATFFDPANISNYPTNNINLTPQSTSAYNIGLKNWFGTMIHSFTLDYNGTTIIQQTPFINLWNTFRLMTSLSWSDVTTQGTVIGFYPDTSTTWTFTPAGAVINAPNFQLALAGNGVCNNTVKNLPIFSQNLQNNNFDVGSANIGLAKRIQNINFDLDGLTGSFASAKNSYKFAQFFNGGSSNGAGPGTAQTINNTWKSYISFKQSQTAANAVAGALQYSIVATIYLKHIHNFFNMVPLLKGTFMKMTLNLNNTTTTFQTLSQTTGTVSVFSQPAGMTCTSVTTPYGGANPIMIGSSNIVSTLYPAATADVLTYFQNFQGFDSGSALFPYAQNPAAGQTADTITTNYSVNISVGATCLNSQLSTLVGGTKGQLSQSVYLYVPSYTFNSPFEQAYLSQSVKTIKYTDVYQYQVLNVLPNGQFNSLITNGISNIKSVLILPFFNSGGTNSGFLTGLPVWQSPFDPAGGGPTSPLIQLINFNVQIAGQNAIYNTQRYQFEEFNNQLYGCNAVNGGLTDGLTSGLIGRQDFDMEYCYYYVNVERMLPVEETVPKSVNILGTNNSAFAVDLIVWVEYGNEIKIDPLTGARV